MPRTPEQRFYDALHHATPKTWQLTRIETSTMSGVPDLFLAGIRHDESHFYWWLELKSYYGVLAIRPWQYAWLTKSTQMGVRCLVLNRHPNTLEWSAYDPRDWTVAAGAQSIKITSPPVSCGLDLQALVKFLSEFS